MQQYRFEQRAIQQAGAGFYTLRADHIHVANYIVTVAGAAFWVEAQAPHDNGLAVDHTVGALWLHHGRDIAVAAFVEPVLPPNLVLQRQHRQLDAQVLAVQGLAACRFGSVIQQFAADQGGVGGADVDAGNKGLDVVDGQPRRDGLARIHAQ